MHKHRENGSVATISSIETKASSRAQHPGPSGSAVREKNKRKLFSGSILLYPIIDFPYI